MNVERRSSFCIRYMPTLRAAGARVLVITAGSVMNGAGSPGQQRWIGSRSRSTASPVEHDLLARPRPHRLRHRVGDRLQLRRARAPSRRGLAAAASRARPRAARRRRRGARVEGEAHAPLGAELVDQQRVLGAFRALEEQRRPARLDRPVDDLGDLEVRVDLGGDADEFALALEQLDPRAQVGRWRHARESRLGPFQTFTVTNNMTIMVI